MSWFSMLSKVLQLCAPAGSVFRAAATYPGVAAPRLVKLNGGSALREPTSLCPLRRSAETRTSRPPDILRHLTKVKRWFVRRSVVELEASNDNQLPEPTAEAI